MWSSLLCPQGPTEHTYLGSPWSLRAPCLMPLAVLMVGYDVGALPGTCLLLSHGHLGRGFAGEAARACPSHTIARPVLSTWLFTAGGFWSPPAVTFTSSLPPVVHSGQLPLRNGGWDSLPGGYSGCKIYLEFSFPHLVIYSIICISRDSFILYLGNNL